MVEDVRFGVIHWSVMLALLLIFYGLDEIISVATALSSCVS